MNNKLVDRIYKILLIGDSNVGKTSIILRFTDNTFDNTGISTLGVDVKCKFVSYNIRTQKAKCNCYANLFLIII